ncbi:MAG TPA: peptidylprolyl isomerase [Clostridiales bacterium]|nr:peptidylprolyl isomerase [Clostridiales bacterium]
MNNRRGILFSVLVIVLAVALSGCNLVRVNEEKDRKLVVAKVNGIEILKGEVLDQYHASYGDTEEYDKEILLRILDGLIEEELVWQKAEAAGHVINEEILNRAEQDYEQAIREYGEFLKGMAQEDAESEEDYEQQAREMMEEYIKESGQTEEEYLELLGKYIAIQDYFSELTADLQIEDEEIDEYYQEELEFQKNSPSLAAQYSKVEIVTEPASRLVKHILIKIADEDTQAISSLRQENKAEEADALREEKLEVIRDNAQKVLDKAKSGEDFEGLIDQYGEDPGMELEDYKDGYFMLRDEGMMEEFVEASFQLQEGEISDLVATDYGYHIIKVYEAKEDKIASLEDVKEDIRTELLNRKKSDKINELIKQWLEEAEVKKFENRL